MRLSNIELGRMGEERVVAYVQKHGHTIIDRNWRVREGEIDIVSMDQRCVLHFIEVKTRTSIAYGHPFEAINREKAHRLQKLALAWLATHGALAQEYSIDVAALLVQSDGELKLEIRENVL